MTKITPFLMFQGNAEEAIRFYTTIIEDSSIKNVIRYGKDEAGEEGSIMQAVFTLKNQEFMCIDSNIAHDFGFTPHSPFMLNVKQRSKLTIIIKHSLVEAMSLWLLEIIPSAENLDGLSISMGFPGSLLFHLING